jgi:hypothetical protein
MQRRRMQSMSSSHDPDDLEGSSTSNPLHSLSDQNRPSDAYMESMKRARASKEHSFIDDRRLLRQHFGIKTKLAAFGFLTIGLVSQAECRAASFLIQEVIDILSSTRFSLSLDQCFIGTVRSARKTLASI